jgi:hypothetical protein
VIRVQRFSQEPVPSDETGKPDAEAVDVFIEAQQVFAG